MKKRLFSLIAVGFAMGFSAFTIVGNHQAPVTLTFMGNSQCPGEVMSNILYIDLGATSCGFPQHRICSIQVDDEFVDNTMTPAVLGADVTLSCSQLGSSEFYQPVADGSQILSVSKKAD